MQWLAASLVLSVVLTVLVNLASLVLTLLVNLVLWLRRT
jgi:hypothetical protein